MSEGNEDATDPNDSGKYSCAIYNMPDEIHDDGKVSIKDKICKPNQ